MFFIIVVALVFPHYLEHRYASRRKEAVCADYDEYHRHKEQNQRHARRLCKQRYGVSASERQHADNGDRPFDSRLALAYTFAFQKLYRLHKPDAAYVIYKHYSEYRPEHRKRIYDRKHRHLKAKRLRHSHKVAKQQQRKLRKQYPSTYAEHNRYRADI